MDNEINKFLKTFHGEEKIHFRAIKDKAVNLYDTYINLEEKLINLNNEGYNIYFMVNGGGTHIAEINKINAVFVDFDCGKDENKQYYPLEKTKIFKDECIKKVDEFIYKPSFIIETRNGIHAYWILNEGATNEQYLNCQLRLIQYFNSDSAIKDLTRIMRIPNFYWMKDINNKFMCRILSQNNNKYNIGDIMNELPEIINKNNEKEIRNNEKNTIQKKKYNNIDLIKQLKVNELKSILFKDNSTSIGKGGTIYYIKDFNISFPLKPQDEKIIVTNRTELYDVINKIDMLHFLGLNSNKFNCIFHEDNKPSANIFINSETGHYIYKCFSEKCKFPSGNIIRVVEKLAHCTKPKAINFIKNVYNIEIQETEWQKEQKELIELNKEYLYNDFKDEHPALYKRIKNYIPLLQAIHDIAKMNVYDEALGNDDKVIFFASTRYIQQIAQTKSIGKTNDRINLFVFLNLLNKLDESQIPQSMLGRAKYHQIKNNQKKIVSHYSIPSYDNDCLDIAEDMAKLFDEKNMTMKGWSRELLIRIFGENSEIVNKIYPQYKGQKLSKKSEDFAEKFDNIILDLINKHGYATEKDILELLSGYKELNKIKIKRVLEETIEKYGLKRVRANKEIKEHYEIVSNGYPFIIIKD